MFWHSSKPPNCYHRSTLHFVLAIFESKAFCLLASFAIEEGFAFYYFWLFDYFTYDRVVQMICRICHNFRCHVDPSHSIAISPLVPWLFCHTQLYQTFLCIGIRQGHLHYYWTYHLNQPRFTLSNLPPAYFPYFIP